MTDNISRRKVLGFGAAAVAGGIGALTGSTIPLGAAAAPAPETLDADPEPYCVNPSTLTTHSAVGGARCMNEGGGAGTILINQTFHHRLEDWRLFWQANCPYPWSTELWNLGAYSARDGRCESWHESGRAIDITALRDDVTTMHFWARYDRWKDLSNADAFRRKYWSAAASFHYHFRHVLTYLYDAAHHNHMHVDNGVSGGGYSYFKTTAEAQVQGVKGICGNVWGYPCGTDRVWNSAVDAASVRVLARIGKGGHLTTSQSHWQAFLLASVRHGTGKQTY